ncbi:MAG: hypothetical protein U9Q63_04270 [Patescibacteria group bacterium]|nr:hypothetical protein [Patescibacteria group bacterium]
MLEYINTQVEVLEGPGLKTFQSLEPDQLIIASGSIRMSQNRLKILPEKSSLLVQAPLSDLKLRLKQAQISEKYEDVYESIITYKELPNQWQINEEFEANDGQVSLQKARITAAAAILLQIVSNKDLPREIKILSRDYVVINYQGNSFDKPLYKEDRPVAIEQIEHLYRPAEDRSFQKGQPVPFYTANSTCFLTINTSEHEQNLDLLKNLTNTQQPLKPSNQTQTHYSFMALLPSSDVICNKTQPSDETIFNLFKYFLQPPSAETAQKLVKPVPGFVDWSRPPFNKHLKVFQIKGQSIFTNLKNLHTHLQVEQGQWLPYLDLLENNPYIANELVGCPTHTLKAYL